MTGETDKNHRNGQTESILKVQKNILTNNRISTLNVDARTERLKQKMKNEAPYVLLLLK